MDQDRGRYPALAQIEGEHCGERSAVASVDVNFFDVLHTTICAGRNFNGVDSFGSRRSVIVNGSFVREYFGAGNVIGHQVRYRDDAAPNDAGVWYTIIGVAREVALTIDPSVPDNAGSHYVMLAGARNVRK